MKLLHQTAEDMYSRLPVHLGKEGDYGDSYLISFTVADTARDGNPEIAFGYKFTGLTADAFDSKTKRRLQEVLRMTVRDGFKPFADEMRKYKVGCRIWFANVKGKVVDQYRYTAEEIYGD